MEIVHLIASVLPCSSLTSQQLLILLSLLNPSGMAWELRVGSTVWSWFTFFLQACFHSMLIGSKRSNSWPLFVESLKGQGCLNSCLTIT